MKFIIEAASASNVDTFKDRYSNALSRFNMTEHKIDDNSKSYITISLEHLVDLQNLLKSVGEIIMSVGASFIYEEVKDIDGYIIIYDDWVE